MTIKQIKRQIILNHLKFREVVFIIIRGLDTLSVGGGNKKLKIEKYSVYSNF